MKKIYSLILFALSLAVQPCLGQFLIPSTTPQSQNFDGMGSSATATLPAGFRVSTANVYSGGTTATTQAAGTSGAGVLASNSSGGTYNFANGVTASATDRALGFLNSGGFTTPRHIMVEIQNTTGATITQLDISFDYEKYRSGSRAFNWTFFSGTDGTNWVARTSGDQSYSADANNNVVSNPPTSIAKTVSITGLSIPNNGVYYFLWTFTGVGGSSNGQGIGIDNVSITANPAPACAISAINITNASGCNNNGTPADGSDDFFTADVTVNYSNPAASGTLNLTGDVLVGGGALSVAVGSLGSPTSHTFTGVRFKADGTASAVTATFSATPTCTFSISNGPTVESCAVQAISALGTCAGVSVANENTYNVVITGLNPAETYTISIDGNVSNNITGVSSFTSPSALSYVDGTETVTVIVTPNSGSPTTILVHEVLCTDADDDGDLDFNTSGCDVDLDAEDKGYIVATVAPYVGENTYLYVLTNSNNQAIAANNSGLFTGLAEGEDYHVVALNFVDAAEANAYESDLTLDSEDGTIIDGNTNPGDCGINCGIATYDIDCFQCPVFANTTADQSVCSVEDLENIVVQINQNNIDVKFVYFPTPKAGTTMYTGGTAIGAAQTPAGASAPFTATALQANLPTAPGTYYIYAILDTNDPDLSRADCRPFEEVVLSITQAPSAEFSYDYTAFCVGDSSPVLTHTTGVDGIYSATGGLSIDKKTGKLNLVGAVPGNYTITNTIPANGTVGNLVLTGVIDGPLTGGIPKAVELYVVQNIPDLSIYSVKVAANGSSTFSFSFTLSGSATAGQYLYVATESAAFTSFFGFAPTFNTTGNPGGTVPNINGDDVIGLFRNADLIDQIGELGVDGSNTPWDYEDGWIYRKFNGYGPDGGFILSNWIFSGRNALDGETTNASADEPFPIRTYKGGLGCPDVTHSVEIVINDCKVDITDPCVCTGPTEVIDNGTFSNAGVFKELVEVTAPTGQNWVVDSVAGLFQNTALTLALTGATLVETPAGSGKYLIEGYHQDSVGYYIRLSNGRGSKLDTNNICYYPDPSIVNVPSLIAPNAAPFIVNGVVANAATGTGTFSLNNVVQPGAGPAPTALTINPATLLSGDNILEYTFNADTAGNQNLADPGCAKTVRQILRVANCACQDVFVSLDANCQFVLTGNLVSDANCGGGTVRVMDNDPTNGDTIDCAGVWTYGLFDSFGNIICWGKVTAEDKTPPAIVCTDWYKGTLDCYDVDFVLNNRQTIGSVSGTTSSPRPSPNSEQTIINAEGGTGTGVCNLTPPSLVADNINNLGYTYFADNCKDCGCRTTVKWNDKVIYYSCDQMKTNGGIYAKIFRTWTATDCKGMRRDTVQEIPFARPVLKNFTFNGDGEGKYDRVVIYPACTPDKELIQKADVTPFICSYFNRTDAPRLSRCLYLDEVECNYSVSIKDTEFPVCGGKGLKIDREMYVFDWCKGGIIDTFHILIKIGDFEAPTLEYAHHAPYDVSTGPMDCTAAIPTTAAGIKAQFGVSITDVCSLGNISVKVKTKDRYVKGIVVAEDVWEKVDYAVMNGMMIGLPVGRHRLFIDASDGCYNVLRDSFEFNVADKIAPVMKCDDDLHVTLSNANGYTNGYAQVSAADIDEGSWDNCKLAWIAVRRNVPASCEASFVQKGYDSNGNGTLDAAPFDHPKDAPAGFDWSTVDGVDLNDDGDISDFGEFVATKGGKKMTPLLDLVEFFCCDLTERVTVELWGADTADDPKTLADETNYNYCWMDLLIEDKVTPTCIAPWDVTIDCDDKNIALIDDKVASSKIWGDVTITTGNDCAALDTVYSVEKSLKCGYGKIVRKWTLSKQTAKGPITITCSQTIWIRPIHQYDICFPKDVSTDCKTPTADTVIVDELACDLLAVNVSDKRYDATEDECYKIFRTYTVINWCAYDDKCGDPMAEGNVFVVDRSLWGNNGKNPIYVLTRDRDRDLNEEFWLSKDLTVNNGDDIYVRGDGNYGGLTLGANVTVSDKRMPACDAYDLSTDHFQDWEYHHSFMYTQIIKVYDDVRPEVTGIRDTFCTSPTACTANITKVVTLKDNCSDKVSLETQYLMIAPFQATAAGSMIPYSTPRWSTKDLGNGNYEISVTNLPEGTHDLIVVGRDECGNLSVATRIPFVVKDCKAPAPICINGLSVDLMPDGNGGGMMTVWASDFVASKIYDCNGQGPETKDGLKLVTKYSVNRVKEPVNPNQTSISVNCADLELGFILVELHAWDEAGNHDFCITFVEVQDNNKVCPAPADKIGIAGTIATEGAGNLQGVTVTLSGGGTQNDMTGVDGNYEFVNLARGGDFTVTPQLDKNHLNGVSTFDLVLIQKHILGVQALNSPYKMIAADANNSKTITTLDMIQIRKLILNIDTHFANNTSWRFVDAAYRFPNTTNPWVGTFPEVVSVNDLTGNIKANFVAIKVGDVNASASISGATAAEIRTNSNFELKTQEQNLKAGNEYKIAFTAADLKNIQGYQFALNLDQSKVELLDIEHGVAKAENFGVFKQEGIITTSWNAKYEPGTLFTLILRAKADSKLSQSLSLNRLVNPEAYDQNSEYLGIKLAFEGEQTSEIYELKQNTPNPFGAETSIGFTLPKAAKATLSIRDVKGALVYKVEGSYAKGSNQIMLKKEQLGASGVLYYTLETNDFTATKKMIILQ